MAAAATTAAGTAPASEPSSPADLTVPGELLTGFVQALTHYEADICSANRCEAVQTQVVILAEELAARCARAKTAAVGRARYLEAASWQTGEHKAVEWTRGAVDEKGCAGWLEELESTFPAVHAAMEDRRVALRSHEEQEQGLGPLWAAVQSGAWDLMLAGLTSKRCAMDKAAADAEYAAAAHLQAEAASLTQLWNDLLPQTAEVWATWFPRAVALLPDDAAAMKHLQSLASQLPPDMQRPSDPTAVKPLRLL
jgi:hypothetical protein